MAKGNGMSSVASNMIEDKNGICLGRKLCVSVECRTNLHSTNGQQFTFVYKDVMSCYLLVIIGFTLVI